MGFDAIAKKISQKVDVISSCTNYLLSMHTKTTLPHKKQCFVTQFEDSNIYLFYFFYFISLPFHFSNFIWFFWFHNFKGKAG